MGKQGNEEISNRYVHDRGDIQLGILERNHRVIAVDRENNTGTREKWNADAKVFDCYEEYCDLPAAFCSFGGWVT